MFATVCTVGSIGVLSTAAQQLQPPTFRSGVRLVEVDVVVRDRNDGFVDTLTKDDFEIFEDGKPQQIQQLWVVNLPTDRRTSVPAVAATPLAVVGSPMDVGRLYVLVLGSGGVDRVQSIARQFITEFLGPTDLMAVANVSNRTLSQGLTADRQLLLAAVDRYRGGGASEASLRMLKEIVVNLNASTGRRKSVLFIGAGFQLWSPEFTDAATATAANLVDQGVEALKTVRVFEDLTRTAKRNNVRIYPIDPGGWSGGAGGDQVASLRIMAADTGGVSIANTNNYRGNFPAIVRDNSAYYLLTYDSTAEADGRAHPITVRLRNRADLSLQQGRESFNAPTPDTKGRSVRLPRSLSAAARSALAVPSPNAPRVELLTAVFQAAGFDGSILIGTHVPGALLRLDPKETIELSYVAVDRWGAIRAVERRAFTVNLGAQSRALVERTGLRLFGRLQVPRGQYEIRVTAHQANGTTASAVADVDVPDFADQPLTVSDFVVASSQGPSLMTLEQDALLRGALPVQPTPNRRFPRGDKLTVFAEIYDSHWILSQEVGVTMTVSAVDGRLVFRGEQVLTTANKGRFYLTGTLALGTFAPGDYQLLVEAHTRKGIPANASRQMRFAVLDEESAPVIREGLSADRDVLEFDFVSVRRSSPASIAPGAVTSATRTGFLVLQDGRFEARGQTLASLARVAFGFESVDPSRGVVDASEPWVWNDRFDVIASAGQPWTKPPSGTTVPAELRTMLRALLEDRFALQARIVTKKVDVTALRLAKPEKLGPGLRPSTAVCRGPFTDASPGEASPRPRCPYLNTASELKAQAATMSEVAQLIAQNFRFATYPVIVDETGLPGLYDVSFSVRRGLSSVGELEEQLGLRLQPTSMPLPTLTFDRARKPRED